MNKKLETDFNKQIMEELHSAYIYLAMSAWAKEKSLDGFGNWFEVQFKEEMDHAMGFYNYILSVGGSVKLMAIAEPKIDVKKPEDLFSLGLEHERYITSKIHDLYLLAQEEGDVAAQSFLKWYVDEQVEEEDNASKYLERVKMAGDGAGLLMLDQELLARIHTPASILSQE
ncbi:ferritin [Patescibacteria group bacterium]